MMNVERFKLKNGLRVVFFRDSSTEMVHVNVLYGVGAKNESDKFTGLFEAIQ